MDLMETGSGLTRRRLLRAALAIGGASGLTACIQLSSGPNVPSGTDDISTYPAAQFAWNDALVTDQHGNTVAPHYQLMLFLRYTGSIPPTNEDRETVEFALRTLEQAFQRGTGRNPDALSLDGLLMCVGYSPDYFARFDDPLPDSVNLLQPEAVLRAIDEDEGKADHHDAVVLLTSDRVEVLLAAEQALRGNRDTVNGVTVSGSLADVFAVADRRTGFKGQGLVSSKLAEHAGVDAVHEESPSAMGYKSGFSDNQAPESRVTIKEGPFADGSTLHVSELGFDLDAWYALPESERVNRMFSPKHTPNQVGEVGKFLASDSRVSDDLAKATVDNAADRGVVGHTQKLARARDDDFEPKILRRSEAISAADGDAALNFTSLQRTIDDFIETRRAMTGIDFDSNEESSGASACPVHNASGSDCPVDNGILSFIETRHRANFLVPPRELRALPRPR